MNSPSHAIFFRTARHYFSSFGCSGLLEDCPDIKVVSLVFSVDVGYGKVGPCYSPKPRSFLFSLLGLESQAVTLIPGLIEEIVDGLGLTFHLTCRHRDKDYRRHEM